MWDKKNALKGALAISLLMNQFSSFSVVVNASTSASEIGEVSSQIEDANNTTSNEVIDSEENQPIEAPDLEEGQTPEQVLPEEDWVMGEIVREENETDNDVTNVEVEFEIPNEVELEMYQVIDESNHIEDIIQEEISEDAYLINIEEEQVSVESRSIGSGLVQLWQEIVPGQEWKENKTSSQIMSSLQCRPNHDLYPISGGASHQTYVNSCYVDDALYLGEDNDYFHIYIAGYEGRVLKSKTHTFSADLNGDGVKVDYQINTIARFIPSGGAKMLTEEVIPLDVPLLDYATDTLNKDFLAELERETEMISESETPESRSWIVNSPSYYANENGTLIHYLTSDVRNTKYTKTIVGKAPSWMQSGVRYYSYDGIYFYLNWQSIRPDGSGAYNVSQPYHNYYQYLPFRSKTQYTNQTFDAYTKSNGYTSSSVSRLVNTGIYFATAQERFGTNAALQYAMGIHESGWGTSNISLNKNNLFGVGANDGNPYGDAQGYPSVENGIYYHAERYLSWGYSDPDDWRYYGSHVGNKGSGMNVRYASDPFWGEKIAGWYYRFDQASGGVDHNYYSIGIKQNNQAVDVKSQASSSSKTLYRTKNSSHTFKNYSVLITGTENGFYQIKTDIALNSSGIPQYNATYDWSTSYGYIPTSSISVLNNSNFNDPLSYGMMTNHVEGVSINSKGVLTINGWGIVDGLLMNNKNSIAKELIVTNQSNGTEIKRVTLTNVYGTDLSDWYQKPFDYARYKGTLDLSTLAVGTYHLNLSISNGFSYHSDYLTSNYNINHQSYGGGRRYTITNGGPGGTLVLTVYDVPLQSHVDALNVNSKGVLNINGWALYEGADLNNNNNITELIFQNSSTNQNIKYHTLTNTYGTDLSEWYQGKYNYARYKGEFSLVSLPIGEYRLLVNIGVDGVNKYDKLKSNYVFSNLEFTAKGRRFTFSNTGKGTSITLKVEEEALQNHVDSIQVSTSGQLNLHGWAFYKGASFNKNDFQKRLIFRKLGTEQDVMSGALTNKNATDLSDWYKGEYNYARYSGGIDIKKIPSGHYQLLLEIDEDDAQKVDTLKSNYAIQTASTILDGRRYMISNSGAGTAIILKVEDLSIENHVDSINVDTKGALNLYGWGFYEGADFNDSSSHQKEILVKNTTNGSFPKRAVLSNVYGTDLSEWKNKPLNYARYRGSLDLTSLVNGTYQLYLGTRIGSVSKVDVLRSNYDLGITHYVANGRQYTISNTGVGSALTLEIKDVPLENHVDTFQINNQGNLNIYGWAFYGGANLNESSSVSKQLTFQSSKTGKDVQSFSLTNVYSTDLSDWKKMKLNYARYRDVLDLNGLPAGEYRIFFTLDADNTQKRDILKSNYAINKTTSYANGRQYIVSNTGEGTAITLKIVDLPL